MPSVDNRVVQISFDNRQFEQNIAKTLESLDKLNKTIANQNSMKNLGASSGLAQSLGLDGISSAIQNISDKFSTMGVVAASVINNITNQAIAAGERIAKSLTLQPVIDGLNEYATNMNSVQTILANTSTKGTTLSQVNAALDELNTYSDQTIYNFGEMAKNIGTFTAAGVDLNTATSSIKGIANIAAMSGSSAEQAAGAMYQLSQAIAQGSVRLMDWRSVITANMGGEVFKTQLFETAKALGTLSNVPMDQTFEQWTAAGNNFQYTLDEGWLTSKVLTTTLTAMTGDLNKEQLRQLGYSEKQAAAIYKQALIAKAAAQDVKTVQQLFQVTKENIGSGWAQSFRILVGDFEQAKALWSGVNNIISAFVNRSSENRNNLLSQFSFLGGRQELIDGVAAAFFALGKILGTVKSAFRDIFPKKDAFGLFEMARGFKELMQSLMPSQTTLNQLRAVFRGVFSVLAIGWEVVKNIFGAFKLLFSTLKENIGGSTLSFFTKFGDSLYELKRALVDDGGIANFFEKFINPVARFIGNIDYITGLNKLTEGFNKLKEAITDLVTKTFGKFAGSAKNVADASDNLSERWGWVISIGQKLGQFSSWLQEKWEAFANFAAGLFEKITESFAKADYSKLQDILNVGIFAFLIKIFKDFVDNGIFGKGANGMFGKIGDSFDELTNTMKTLQTSLKADILQKIAIAIGILTASVVVLSLIDSGALTKSMVAMAAGFAQLMVVFNLLNNNTDAKGTAKLPVIASSLILLSSAILVLSLAVAMLATIEPERLLSSITGISALLAALVITLKNMDNPVLIANTAGSLILLGVAINVMAVAVKMLGSMSSDELLRGMLAFAGILTAITIAINSMPAATLLIGLGPALLGLGASILIITLAIELLGRMKTDQLVQGLVAFSAILTVIALTTAAMPRGLSLIGPGLLSVATSLIVIVAAIKILGEMDTNKLIQGLVAIAATMTILAIATNLMSTSIASGVGIIIIAAALVILTEVIAGLAELGLGKIALGIGAIAAVFLVLGIAAALMEPILPALLGLSIALIAVSVGFAIFGAAALMIASAVYVIALAFALIASVGEQGVTVLMDLISQFILKLPELATALALSLVNFAVTLLENAPQILDLLGGFLTQLLDKFIELIPKIGEVIRTLISELLKTIVEKGPEIIAAGLVLLNFLLQGIDDNIENITNKVIDIVKKFADTFASRAEDIKNAGAAILGALLDGIGAWLFLAETKAGEIIDKLILGLGGQLLKLLDAGKNVIIALMNGAENATEDIIDAAVKTTATFLDHLADDTKKISDSMFDFLIKLLNGLRQSIDEHQAEVRDAGMHLVGAIINAITLGLGDKLQEVKNAASALAGGILQSIKDRLGIKSPSKEVMKLMKFVSEGVVVGLSDDKVAVNSARAFGKGIVSALEESLTSISSVLDSSQEFNPTIKPVIDMSNVDRGITKLNNISKIPEINAAVSFNNAAIISELTQPQAQTEQNASNPVQEIKFEQTINAPKALDAAEIYRQTKSQIYLAKEALKI